MSGHPLTESEFSTSIQEQLGKLFAENTKTTQLLNSNISDDTITVSSNLNTPASESLDHTTVIPDSKKHTTL